MTAQLIPYLAVRDARAAMAWYTDALGARVVGDPYVMDDDRIGHAELDVAGAPLYLADEYPELGLTAPDGAASASRLHLPCRTSTRAVARAETVGATVERPPADAPYGRTAVIVDPYGHRWMLQTPSPPTRRPVARPGDAVYLHPAGARRRPRPRLLRGGARLVDGSGPGGRRLARSQGHDPDDRPARRRTRPRRRRPDVRRRRQSRSPWRPSAPPAGEAGDDRARQSYGLIRPSAATTRACRFWLGQLG